MSATASSTLPDARTFLESLLPPISAPASPIPPSSQSTNPLQSDQKPLLLTLHCLFPNELLPALDLLDRRLVTRLILADPGSADAPNPDVTSAATSAEEARVPGADALTSDKLQKRMAVYYVRSSYTSLSRYSAKRNQPSAAEGMSYEVRLQAWNCTCAAFAFAAFRGDWDEMDLGNGKGRESPQKGGDVNWSMGGSSLGHGVPICKHILACVLAERVRGLGPLVEERAVSREEMAGYTAGWMG